jgi:type III secretion system FlhB-like substrate exporter
MADHGPNKVVGLKYDPEQGLPRVILKGSGKLAEEIIAAGKQIEG